MFMSKIFGAVPTIEEQKIKKSVDNAIGYIDDVEKSLLTIREYQDEIENAKKLWEATFNSVNSCIAVLDVDGHILEYNKPFRNTVSRSHEEIMGHSICEVFCEKESLCTIDTHENVCVTRCDKEKMTLHGRIFEVYVNLVTDEYLGKTYGCVFVATDVTEHVAAAKEMEQTKLRYKAFFENSPYGVVVLDPATTKIVEFNNQAAAQLGYTCDEFKRLQINDIDATETEAETKERLKRILEEGKSEFDVVHRTKDGELRNVKVKVTTIKVDEDKQYVYAVFNDVTEQLRTIKALEVALEQCERNLEND